MKISIEDVSQTPASNLSKTERRRLAKQAKKKRKRESPDGKAGETTASGAIPRKQKGGLKPKRTKEERKELFTKIARKAREKRAEQAPGANKTLCFGCRAWGHVVANCPDAKASTGKCFNCGSTKHALRVCPKPQQKDGSLPHATCFVCKQDGHMSGQCMQNANGVYPKGGSCKGCGSRLHLSKNCPDNPQPVEKNPSVKENETVESTGKSMKKENKNARAGEKASEGRATEGSQDGQGGRISSKAPVERQAKQPALESQGRPAQGKQTGSVRLPGGDDLDDDDYWNSDNASDMQDDNAPEDRTLNSRTGKLKAETRQKKKAKVVVF